MNFYWSDLGFAIVCGLYSVAVTRQTVGLPLNSPDEIINAVALFISAGIGGLIFYKANPEASLLQIFKRPEVPTKP